MYGVFAGRLADAVAIAEMALQTAFGYRANDNYGGGEYGLFENADGLEAMVYMNYHPVEEDWIHPECRGTPYMLSLYGPEGLVTEVMQRIERARIPAKVLTLLQS